MKTATKKANRGHLKRAAAKGALFVRVRYSHTDDYARDAETNSGRETEFKKVFIMAEHVDSVMPDNWKDLPSDEWESLLLEANAARKAHYENQKAIAVENNAVCYSDDFLGKRVNVYGTTESGMFNTTHSTRYEYQIRG